MLILLSLIALAAWVYIAGVRPPVFRALPRLPPARTPGAWPEVVAVIPARNEAETIGAVVAAHQTSDYRGGFRIIVVDDHSTDATAARVRSAMRHRAVELMEAPPLPAGWSGKLNAVNAGLKRADEIAPAARYFLLTDADILLAPTTLSRLVALAEARETALLSLMARLDARGFWGGLLIPAFVFFFQKLYPIHLANDPESRVAAAAGGVMLIRRDALDAIGGVSAIRGSLIDDCALAGAVKKSGRCTWIGLAKDEAVSLRDNRSLSSIWKMVSRTAFTQLSHSWALLAGVVVGMLLLYAGPPAIALSLPLHKNEPAAAIGAAAWALMTIVYMRTARLYDQAPWKPFFLPIAATLYVLMTMSSAIDHARGCGGAWKGRTYPA